jgi:RNA polymerase sigma-70 factor, ECF subfamily
VDEVTQWALDARDSLITSHDPVVRNRHERAVTQLVRSTQPDVWRFISRLTDSQRADDLTQETYLRAWKSLPRYRGESSARVWLLGIANHVVADHVRLGARRSRLLSRGGLRAVTLDPTDDPAQVDGRLGQTELDALVAALDHDLGVPFVLTQVIGLTYAEAAEACGVPVGTIRSRVFRARDALAGTVRRSEAV